MFIFARFSYRCVRPLLMGGSCSAANMATASDWKSASSIYDFTAKDIDGNDVSLDKYRGHVCLIVNVASK
ncbi:Phospholipid hydroperoxide glutathione peroxidase [Mactra antiquata]